ncbi:MAG: hypothetical protein IKO72_12440 [Kiritimatiellae bacterium]|nr:hypothetical protein [Kiritimatiellia bacterium]
MDARHIIPICLAAFDFVEAVICVWYHDYARSWYWAAAGQITLATVFMKG